jgi:hypothetical protein
MRKRQDLVIAGIGVFSATVVIAGQKNGRVYCEMNRIFRIFSLAILLLLIA